LLSPIKDVMGEVGAYVLIGVSILAIGYIFLKSKTG